MSPTPPPSPDSPLSDEAMLEIRRAYHALEAFQLSPEHHAAREELKSRLAKLDSLSPSSTSDSPKPGESVRFFEKLKK